MNLVLASQSPRRRELLSVIQKDFTVRSSDVEEIIPDGLTAEETVVYLAKLKAEEVAQQLKKERDSQENIVVGADTVVVLDGEIMGKPKDYDDCVRMISRLSGRQHEVYTVVAIVVNGQTESFYQRTAVRFLDLTKEEIEWYASLQEPYDKAGAYGIQGFGSLLVEGIDGDYFNVMGLPVAALNRRLKKYLP